MDATPLKQFLEAFKLINESEPIKKEAIIWVIEKRFIPMDEPYYNSLTTRISELEREKDEANKGWSRAIEISLKTSEDNNELKKEIEKIKGEKKKEYQRAQGLVSELAIQKKKVELNYNEILRLESELSWISVEDRLPENSDDVLTLSNDGECYVTFCTKTLKFKNHSADKRIVTHWKPLPQPPKKEGEKG